MVGLLAQVDAELAARVAEGLGFAVPAPERPLNQSIPADGDVGGASASRVRPLEGWSLPPSRWRIRRRDRSPRGRWRFWPPTASTASSLDQIRDALLAAGARGFVVAPRLGTLQTSGGDIVAIDHSLLTTSSVLFDAVYVPGGAPSVAALLEERDALDFVAEAYRHCKPMGASSEGVRLLRSVPGVLPPAEERRGATKGNGGSLAAEGIIVSDGAADGRFTGDFLGALGEHRFWTRSRRNRMGAAEGADETRGRPPLPPPPPTRGEKRL